MASASEVKPKKWTNLIVLYDDGKYSAVWGNIEKQNTRSLGVRWNGNIGNLSGKGFPSQGKNPIWYSEPDFLWTAILLALQKTVAAMPDSPYAKKFEFMENLEIAINECR